MQAAGSVRGPIQTAADYTTKNQIDPDAPPDHKPPAPPRMQAIHELDEAYQNHHQRLAQNDIEARGRDISGVSRRGTDLLVVSAAAASHGRARVAGQPGVDGGRIEGGVEVDRVVEDLDVELVAGEDQGHLHARGGVGPHEALRRRARVVAAHVQAGVADVVRLVAGEDLAGFSFSRKVLCEGEEVGGLTGCPVRRRPRSSPRSRRSRRSRTGRC